jgi:UDP-N-acetylmuramoyl-tripeptide--D-alanyl-D-alanine ligase
VIVLTLAEVAAATGGQLVGGALDGTRVTGAVVADSRQVAPGGLFVALPGTRTDGHDFAAAALAAGATAVLASRDVGGPAVIIDDPLAAVGRLAAAVVDRAGHLTVVGVTGSSGKTSTKDLLAGVLAAAGPTVAPSGSFNNELGLPLTALRIEDGTRFLVAEMGARTPGNITYLCGITPPRIAVVLNVGAAHAGVFGSLDATACTKAELVAALPAGGVAVLNSDDPRVAAMAGLTRARVVLTGRGDRAQVRAVDVRLDEVARPRFRLVTPAGEDDVRLRLHGEHHVGNALAAAAVGLEAGLDVAVVAGKLSAAEPVSRWRMDVRTRADGLTVVNDAYNANPDSARAALRALAAMGRGGLRGPRRTWAVLGEMLELGGASAGEHHAVGQLAVELGVSQVVAVGEGAGRRLAEGAGTRACWVPDANAALELLRARAVSPDVVLVKASRAVGLEAVGEYLLAGADQEALA